MVFVRTVFIFIMIVIFFVQSFFPTEIVEIGLGIIVLIVTLLSIPKTKGLPRIFGSTMLIVGTIIILAEDKSLYEWASSITKNLPLVTLILLTPILSIPITLGGYDSSIERFTNRYRKKPGILFLVITLVFNLLSPILNMGSIRLIHSMLNKLNLPTEFLSRAYVRGFGSVITWSPYFAAMMLILTYMDISVTSYLPYGLLLGLSQLVIGNLLFLLVDSKKIDFPVLKESSNGKDFKIPELIIALLIMTGIIFYIESLIHIKMIIVVSLTILIFPLFWSMYLRSIDGFFQYLKRYRKDTVPASSNEVLLFITAGYFGVVLSNTIFGDYLNSALIYMAGKSILMTILLTIITISFLGFLGIHQLVTITPIAASVIPASLGLSNITFALILMSAWATNTFTSPITPVNVTLTDLLNIKFLKLLVKSNGIYLILSVLAHTFIIYIIHLLID